MKRRRLPPDQRLERRYNLCHRLRLKGVAVDTDSNAINIANLDEYNDLSATAKRYVDTLRSDYHFVVQTYIPGGEDEMPRPAVKFHRKRAAHA